MREDGQWKIWSHKDGYEELTRTLLEAKTTEAREQLLASERPEFAIYIIYNLLIIGSDYTIRSKYAEAHDAFDLGLKLADRYDVQKYTVSILYRSGDVYRYQGNFNEALRQDEQARQMAERTNDKPGLLNAYEFYGFTYFALGDSSQAMAYFQKAYDLKDEAKISTAKISEIVDSMGSASYLEGNYGKSLEFYQKAAEWRKDPEGLLGKTSPWNNVGAVYTMIGDYDLAMKFFNLSLDQNIKNDHKEMVGLILGNIGDVNHARGQYSEALDYYKRSLAVAEEVQAKPRIAAALQGVSNQYEELGDYDAAFEYIQKALKSSEDIGHIAMTSSILANLAELTKLIISILGPPH